MSENLATDGESVKPAKRDKLAALGDRLDAAQKTGGDVPTHLIREYRQLVRLRALTAPRPKVTIKTTADYWEADKMVMAAFTRWRDLKAELETIEFRDDGFTWRQLADLQATFAGGATELASHPRKNKCAQRGKGEAHQRILKGKARASATWRESRTRHPSSDSEGRDMSEITENFVAVFVETLTPELKEEFAAIAKPNACRCLVHRSPQPCLWCGTRQCSLSLAPASALARPCVHRDLCANS